MAYRKLNPTQRKKTSWQESVQTYRRALSRTGRCHSSWICCCLPWVPHLRHRTWTSGSQVHARSTWPHIHSWTRWARFSFRSTTSAQTRAHVRPWTHWPAPTKIRSWVHRWPHPRSHIHSWLVHSWTSAHHIRSRWSCLNTSNCTTLI